MARYAEERKEAVIARLSPPENRSPQEVADMEGISLATVYNWRRQAREQGRYLPDADFAGPEGHDPAALWTRETIGHAIAAENNGLE